MSPMRSFPLSMTARMHNRSAMIPSNQSHRRKKGLGNDVDRAPYSHEAGAAPNEQREEELGRKGKVAQVGRRGIQTLVEADANCRPSIGEDS